MGGMTGICRQFIQKNYLDTHLFPNLKTEGVPKYLKKYVYSVKYNDLSSIKKILNKDKDISSIIMEVERDSKPHQNYLRSIRKLCNEKNICLIFDECTTGFRDVYGGLHLKYGVNPILQCLVKQSGMGLA